jgi:hypothetical protein
MIIPPPIKLPRVTGSKLFKNIPLSVISAPLKYPRGIINIFATECSKPQITKRETGRIAARILPGIVLDA